MDNIRLLKLLNPPKQLVTILLPYLRNFDQSLLSFFCHKYIANTNPKKKLLMVLAFRKTKVVGWSVITPDFDTTPYQELFTNKRKLLMLFVDKNYRHLKLGSMLFDALMHAYRGNVSVAKYDTKSTGFFNKMKQKYHNRVNIIDWS